MRSAEGRTIMCAHCFDVGLFALLFERSDREVTQFAFDVYAFDSFDFSAAGWFVFLLADKQVGEAIEPPFLDSVGVLAFFPFSPAELCL